MTLDKLIEKPFPHEQVLFREAKSDDYPLIVQSWSLSYQQSERVSTIPKRVYFPEQYKIIEDSFYKGTPIVLCSVNDLNLIMGYIIFNIHENNLVIDWIGVKKTFRRMGICNFMLENILSIHPDVDNVYYTHWPAKQFEVTVKCLTHSNIKPIRYNPYLQQRYT